MDPIKTVVSWIGIVSCLGFASTSGAAVLPVPPCSQPVTTGEGPAVVDCLHILQAGVGLRRCDPACICRPSGGEITTVTDAMLCLARAVGREADLDCRCVQPEVIDFSGTTHFRFEQFPGFGFCPPFGEIFEAEVARIDDLTYVARLVMLEDGIVGVDSCRADLDIELYEDFDCPILVELPERVLTADQRDAWLVTIGQVEVENLEDPYCETFAFDPCIVEEYSFDDTRISDFYCAAPHLEFAEASRLREALKKIMP